MIFLQYGNILFLEKKRETSRPQTQAWVGLVVISSKLQQIVVAFHFAPP